MSARLAVGAIAATLALVLSGCESFVGFEDPQAAPATVTATPSPTPTCNNSPYESVFSNFGTVHYTRELADDLTMDLDMWTEQLTHEWYPETEKQLNFVINVFDTNAEEDDPFKLKRKVYLSEIVIEANTVTTSGQTETVFSQDLDPIEATLDPEALTSKYGLLITSPKGGFQRLDNVLAPSTLPDTIGINMDFNLTISSQVELGEKKYKTRVYTVQLPVTVFTEETKNTSTSCATSSTLAPVELSE
jgi:hypothetical protein